MAYELKDGQGSLFKNKYHQQGDKSPDYRGTALYKGERIKISAWVKERKIGKFMSLSIQPDKDFGQEHKPEPLPDSDDGSIPF